MRAVLAAVWLAAIIEAAVTVCLAGRVPGVELLLMVGCTVVALAGAVRWTINR
jgi:hypothetical protein